MSGPMAIKKSAKASEKSSSIFETSENSRLSVDDLRESYFKTALPESGPSTRKDKLKNLSRGFSSSFLFKTRRSVAVFTAVITFIVTMSFSSVFAPNQLDTTTLAARISGGVALSEPELREVVNSINQTVYWVGPVSGAKYTINAQNVNTIYVRYLPDGKGISDQTPQFRVIATYKQVNAYEATLTAGNQKNGISFTKNNGTVVYYNKNVPTNVYVAYQTKPYQIEIFDPKAEKSLEIANSNTSLQIIE